MLLTGAAITPQSTLAATPQEIMWNDLISPGVAYSEIIGQGEMDETNDQRTSIDDADAAKLNEELDGAYIKMPGLVVPFDLGPEGVTDFMPVPYFGACIHTPRPTDNLWDPIWVTGLMRTQLPSTNLSQTGYAITADEMEIYVW